MTAVRIPQPPLGAPVAGPGGSVGKAWRDWFQAVYKRLGGVTDKVDEAFTASEGSAPASRLITAGAGLYGGGTLDADITLRLYIAVCPVALLPTASPGPYMAFATDGRKSGEGSGSGTGCPVIWTNSAWYSLFSGAVVTA